MQIKLSDYNFELPEEKIAKHPLEKRENSKLLFYKNQTIEHHLFKDIAQLIPENAILIFNNTKVIPARIFFYKPTGALIEIFLLKPLDPLPVHMAMQEKKSCTWLCMIGNLKKWKDPDVIIREIPIKTKKVVLSAELKDRNLGKIVFSWNDNEVTFAEILENAGEVPLPPYLNRKPTKEDKPRYQTVYSKFEGAVAAPTAGLHFTNDILDDLEVKNIKKEYLTLHVSAGTFQPVKEENVINHPMHTEVMIVRKETIINLLDKDKKVIAVGTTSMRTLESLYWYGVKLHLNKISEFKIGKLDPYQYSNELLPSKIEALESILKLMEINNLEELHGSTEIFIIPGYQFRICEALITNFHLPKSTLILLIAAFVGEDWKKIYKEALASDYRFLSYGDSSLLLPHKQ